MLDILILSGPIRSGKTTRLREWCAREPGVAGVLQPDGPSGRQLVDAAGGEAVDLEPVGPDEPHVAVGRFRFRRAAFDWANTLLANSAADAKAETIVVDEIGPLELSGDGLARGLEAVLARPRGRAVLVVREALLGDVRERWRLGHARVLPATAWPQVGHAERSAP